MNPHPLIYTERSHAHYLLDIVLTALGWLAFCLLFASGTLALFTGRLPSTDELWITSPFVATTRLLIIYAILAGVIVAILIGWAVYNYLRFSGRNRRKPTLPLSDDHLQQSFDLAFELLERSQNARVMVIAHEDDSARISGIEILEKGDLPPAPAQAPPSAIPAPDTRIEPSLRPSPPDEHAGRGWNWQNPAPAS